MPLRATPSLRLHPERIEWIDRSYPYWSITGANHIGLIQSSVSHDRSDRWLKLSHLPLTCFGHTQTNIDRIDTQIWPIHSQQWYSTVDEWMDTIGQCVLSCKANQKRIPSQHITSGRADWKESILSTTSVPVCISVHIVVTNCARVQGVTTNSTVRALSVGESLGEWRHNNRPLDG